MLQKSPFVEDGEQQLPALQTTLRRFRHASGATHLHFDNVDAHRAFCVGFRTSPSDSTGLPHILEHIALCGSQRYPVRDPFFMMLRRSLQTFMNAMTYPDRTCYPFATQNRQDFFNLLGIYLDATFEPQLSAMDFAQEGWRLAPKGEDWCIKGVVYNEMKGAMADSDSQVWDALGRQLLPDTCYRHNSGGSPLAIPTLAHGDLVAFHRRTYCAANACFATWGDIPLAEVQASFADYCERHPGSAVELPELQAPLDAPQRLDIPVPFQAGQDERDVTLTGRTWVWGDSADIDQVLLGELTDQLLLGHAAAPLRLALEHSALGRSASGSGYQAYLRNGIFTAELSGMEAAQQEALFSLLDSELPKIRDRGFSREELDNALHQLELRRRRIGGDGMPFGLIQCLRAIGVWCCGGDVLPALDQEQALQRLHHLAADFNFWPGFIQAQLIDNPHRADFTCQPDAGWEARFDQQEAALTKNLVSGLSATELAQRRDDDEELNRRQMAPMNLESLPDLDLRDIPAERPFASGLALDAGLTSYRCATGGITSCHLAYPLGFISSADLPFLQTAVGVVGKLGFGDADYQAAARLLDACCGGISAQVELASDRQDLNRVQAFAVFTIHGLDSRIEEWLPLLQQALQGQRFDETLRLRELLLASLSHLNDSIIQAGHSLAAAAAQQGFPGLSGFMHQWSGLGRRNSLRQLLVDQAQPEAALQTYASACQEILTRIRSHAPHLALIHDHDDRQRLQQLVRGLWPQPSNGVPAISELRFPSPQAPYQAQAFVLPTPVNFNAMALSTVPAEHADAPALAVACRYLTHERLHRQIREQGGAYGASASLQSATGTVTLTSYRDPRLADTFAELSDGLLWLHQAQLEAQALKEAKLSLIASIDNPLSPSGEARRSWLMGLIGHRPERLNVFRQRLLAVTVADIHRAAQAHLQPQQAQRATVTNLERAEQSGMNWQVITL
ncbi:MAG: hypothetical protein EA402_11955 [Planctomycetota bacterium]|nr:MAG: hypothetical protein EA402_11955 [Planctomycetota bacterium]